MATFDQLKADGKRVWVVVVALRFFCWAAALNASPVDELTSPSQTVRDAAAAILRKTYSPPPRTNWSRLICSLQLGTSQLHVEKQLQSSNLVSIGGLGSGNTEVKSYRLDDLWVLDCSFTNSTSSITNAGLAFVTIKEQLRYIWVEPPTNHTGVWRTYSVNGQPSHEFHYVNGLPEGILTLFHTNGAKAVVSPQREGVPNGEEIGFYQSGKTNYVGRYRVGKQVGKWLWYKEDGTIESERDFSKP